MRVRTSSGPSSPGLLPVRRCASPHSISLSTASSRSMPNATKRVPTDATEHAMPGVFDTGVSRRCDSVAGIIAGATTKHALQSSYSISREALLHSSYVEATLQSYPAQVKITSELLRYLMTVPNPKRQQLRRSRLELRSCVRHTHAVFRAETGVRTTWWGLSTLVHKPPNIKMSMWSEPSSLQSGARAKEGAPNHNP